MTCSFGLSTSLIFACASGGQNPSFSATCRNSGFLILEDSSREIFDLYRVVSRTGVGIRNTGSGVGETATKAVTDGTDFAGAAPCPGRA